MLLHVLVWCCLDLVLSHDTPLPGSSSSVNLQQPIDDFTALANLARNMEHDPARSDRDRIYDRSLTLDREKRTHRRRNDYLGEEESTRERERRDMEIDLQRERDRDARRTSRTKLTSELGGRTNPRHTSYSSSELEKQRQMDREQEIAREIAKADKIKKELLSQDTKSLVRESKEKDISHNRRYGKHETQDEIRLRRQRDRELRDGKPSRDYSDDERRRPTDSEEKHRHHRYSHKKEPILIIEKVTPRSHKTLDRRPDRRPSGPSHKRPDNFKGRPVWYDSSRRPGGNRHTTPRGPPVQDPRRPDRPVVLPRPNFNQMDRRPGRPGYPSKYDEVYLGALGPHSDHHGERFPHGSHSDEVLHHRPSPDDKVFPVAGVLPHPPPALLDSTLAAAAHADAALKHQLSQALIAGQALQAHHALQAQTLKQATVAAQLASHAAAQQAVAQQAVAQQAVAQQAVAHQAAAQQAVAHQAAAQQAVAHQAVAQQAVAHKAAAQLGQVAAGNAAAGLQAAQLGQVAAGNAAAGLQAAQLGQVAAGTAAAGLQAAQLGQVAAGTAAAGLQAAQLGQVAAGTAAAGLQAAQLGQVAAGTAAAGLQAAQLGQAAAVAGHQKVKAAIKSKLKYALKNHIKTRLQEEVAGSVSAAEVQAGAQQHGAQVGVAVSHLADQHLHHHIAQVRHHLRRAREDLFRRLALLKPYFQRGVAKGYVVPSVVPDLPVGVHLTPLQVDTLPKIPIKVPQVAAPHPIHIPDLKQVLKPPLDVEYIEYILTLPEDAFHTITNMSKRQFLVVLFPRLYRDSVRHLTPHTTTPVLYKKPTSSYASPPTPTSSYSSLDTHHYHPPKTPAPIYQSPKPSPPVYEPPKPSPPVYEPLKPSPPVYEPLKPSPPVYEPLKPSPPVYEPLKPSPPVYEPPKPSPPVYQPPKAPPPLYKLPLPTTPAHTYGQPSAHPPITPVAKPTPPLKVLITKPPPVRVTTLYVPTTRPFVPVTTPHVPTTRPFVPVTTPHVPTTRPFVPVTTPHVPTTRPFVPVTTPHVPTTRPFVPVTTPHVPTTRPFVPVTTPHVPTTRPFIPVSTPHVPTTRPFVPVTTPHVPTTRPFVPVTTPHVPTTRPFVPVSTPHVPTIRPVAPVTTPHWSTPKPFIPVTTPHVPTTKPFVPVTTPYVPTIPPHIYTTPYTPTVIQTTFKPPTPHSHMCGPPPRTPPSLLTHVQEGPPNTPHLPSTYVQGSPSKPPPLHIHSEHPTAPHPPPIHIYEGHPITLPPPIHVHEELPSTLDLTPIHIHGGPPKTPHSSHIYTQRGPPKVPHSPPIQLHEGSPTTPHLPFIHVQEGPPQTPSLSTRAHGEPLNTPPLHIHSQTPTTPHPPPSRMYGAPKPSTVVKLDYAHNCDDHTLDDDNDHHDDHHSREHRQYNAFENDDENDQQVVRSPPPHVTVKKPVVFHDKPSGPQLTTPNTPFPAISSYSTFGPTPFPAVSSYSSIGTTPFPAVSSYSSIGTTPFPAVSSFSSIGTTPFPAVSSYSSIGTTPFPAVSSFSSIGTTPFPAVSSYSSISSPVQTGGSHFKKFHVTGEGQIISGKEGKIHAGDPPHVYTTPKTSPTVIVGVGLRPHGGQHQFLTPISTTPIPPFSSISPLLPTTSAFPSITSTYASSTPSISYAPPAPTASHSPSAVATTYSPVTPASTNIPLIPTVTYSPPASSTTYSPPIPSTTPSIPTTTYFPPIPTTTYSPPDVPTTTDEPTLFTTTTSSFEPATTPIFRVTEIPATNESSTVFRLTPPFVDNGQFFPGVAIRDEILPFRKEEQPLPFDTFADDSSDSEELFNGSVNIPLEKITSGLVDGRHLDRIPGTDSNDDDHILSPFTKRKGNATEPDIKEEPSQLVANPAPPPNVDDTLPPLLHEDHDPFGFYSDYIDQILNQESPPQTLINSPSQEQHPRPSVSTTSGSHHRYIPPPPTTSPSASQVRPSSGTHLPKLPVPQVSATPLPLDTQGERQPPKPQLVGADGLPVSTSTEVWHGPQRKLAQVSFPGGAPPQGVPPRPVTAEDLAKLPSYLREAPTCATFPTNRSFCVLPQDYPSHLASNLVTKFREELVKIRGVLNQLPSLSLDLSQAQSQLPNIDTSVKCESERRTVNLSWSRDVLGNWFVIMQTPPFAQPLTVTTCSSAARARGCRPLLQPRPLIALQPKDPKPRPFVFDFPLPVACVFAAVGPTQRASSSPVTVVVTPDDHLLAPSPHDPDVDNSSDVNPHTAIRLTDDDSLTSHPTESASRSSVTSLTNPVSLLTSSSSQPITSDLVTSHAFPLPRGPGTLADLPTGGDVDIIYEVEDEVNQKSGCTDPSLSHVFLTLPVILLVQR
ncbi:uncharacterized protein [Panulirus ornatus]|uniref:uncharacterized protein isoform X4 n=1 Tax=Panulirus ornatus TaxID=150431 RepID=UPI003A84405A